MNGTKIQNQLRKMPWLTFDDVLLKPQFSDIASRKEIDLSSWATEWRKLDLPIWSANMDTVTEYHMAEAMFLMGGMGIIHRFMEPEAQARICRWLSYHGTAAAAAAIGLDMEDVKKRVPLLIESGCRILCIDVAHGHHARVGDLIMTLRDHKLVEDNKVEIIAGNVATPEGAMFLASAGANAVKVGVGPGSLCTTRIVTGHGVPQLSAIMECASAVRVPIIADGGIRNSGDIVKALAAGASSVMIGSMFAGTTESPGDEKDGFKTYRGMASRAAQMDWKGKVSVVEGEEKKVPVRGSVVNILEQLADGMQSGLSYSGARSIPEFQHQKAEFIVISPAGMSESKPHGLSI